MKRKAIQALQKYFESNFTEKEQEDMEFYTDICDINGYTWRMELYGKKINLTYEYKTDEIKEVKVSDV